MYDQVVVLTSFNERAVFTDAFTDSAVLIFAQVCRFRQFVATSGQCQLVKRVTSTRGRRRTHYTDRLVWQAGINIAPVLVRVGYPLAIDRHLGTQGQEQLFQGDVQILGIFGAGDNDTVRTNTEFGDISYAILLAQLIFRRLHTTRSVGNVRVLGTDALTKQLHAATGTGGFKLRGFKIGFGTKALGNNSRKRVDRRGTDNADGVASHGRRRHSGYGAGQYHSCECFVQFHHVESPRSVGRFVRI